MQIFYNSSDFNSWRKKISLDRLIGFVPTMGALHAGHLSLVGDAIKKAEIVVVSIFVNPKQFSKSEDFDIYPRTLRGDIKKLKPYNVSAVFVPEINDIYKNDGFKIEFNHPFAQTLEGVSRPHFFPGVVDVVSRLFNIVKPSFAHFGRKDAQQLILMEKMVDSLGYPIKIIPGDTIREPNGLAMSSRNKYLTLEQKKEAEILFESLLSAKRMLDDGVLDSRLIRQSIINTISKKGAIKIDYVSIVDIESLLEVSNIIRGDILISIAVFVGSVRLIDNVFYTTLT